MESGAKPLVDVDRWPYERSHLGLNTSDVGIFKSTILPSFALHSSFSVAAYALSRATDRGEIKDYFWPLSQVANAWWTAVGEPMYTNNLTFTSAMSAIPWTEKVLLSCVTAWGTRLFYRIASRSLARGRDDPRYEELKAKDPGFWNSALFKLYLPEAAFLTLISLPFTLPFRTSWSSVAFDRETSGVLRALGVGLFSAGFAMEALADTQLELHRKERDDLCRHGVWSIVRHPKYAPSPFFASKPYTKLTNDTAT
jgi:steroid 5-alpha reductase family enzyme